MDTQPCSQCHGKLRIATPAGWVRCSCARSLTASLYIKPLLRGADPEYPVEYDAKEPWPLADMRVSGEGMEGLREFRFMAWRSVRAHLDTGALQTYEVLDASRLVEIRFERDTTYKSTQEIEELGLLIVFYGISPLFNKMVPDLLLHIQMMRTLSGRPTWLYEGQTLKARPQRDPTTLTAPSTTMAAGLPNVDLRRR